MVNDDVQCHMHVIIIILSFALHQRYLVQGVRKGVHSIPPARRFSIFLLYCRTSRHISTHLLVLLISGFSFPLFPLVLLDLVSLALVTPR